MSARAEQILSIKGEFIMNRFKIAQPIALGATACSWIGIFMGGFSGSSIGTILIFFGILGAFVAYIFGGLLAALKMAGGIAKVGWFITPFPIDIFTFFVTLIFGFLALFFVPIIPVRRAYKESGLY